MCENLMQLSQLPGRRALAQSRRGLRWQLYIHVELQNEQLCLWKCTLHTSALPGPVITGSLPKFFVKVRAVTSEVAYSNRDNGIQVSKLQPVRPVSQDELTELFLNAQHVI